MSARQEQERLKALRRKLAAQGIIFDGDKFTYDAEKGFKEFVNSELFGVRKRRR